MIQGENAQHFPLLVLVCYNAPHMKNKTNLSIAAAVVIIIALIVIIVATHHHHKTPDTIPADTAATQAPAQTATTASPIITKTTPVPTKKPASGLVFNVSPQVSFVSADATSTDDGTATKHGVFTIKFQVNAATDDLYISPICSQTPGTDGITFGFTKSGIADTSSIGSNGCLVTSVSGAQNLASGRFKVHAYSAATFQLVIVSHPQTSGNYQAFISQIGYSTTDSKGTRVFSIEKATLDALKTNTISL